MQDKTKKILMWSVIGLGLAGLAYYLYTQNQNQSSSLANEAAAVLPGSGGGGGASVSSGDTTGVAQTGAPAAIAPRATPTVPTIPGGTPGPSTAPAPKPAGGVQISINPLDDLVLNVQKTISKTRGLGPPPSSADTSAPAIVAKVAHGAGAPIGTDPVLTQITRRSINRNPASIQPSLIRPSGASRT